jgi:hypothetical protein
MKYKTTAKALKDGYYKIIRVDYCEFQTLLSDRSPIAYSSGIFGWNFDVYDIDGVAIVTGYRGLPSKNSKEDYLLIRKYEAKAYGKTPKEKDELLKEFIAQVTNT